MLTEVFLEGLNGRPGRCVRVRNRKGFGRGKTVIADLAQRGGNRGMIHVAAPGGLSIAVDKMDVANLITAVAATLRDARLLDVHVKQIGKNLDVIYIQRAQKVRRLANAIEQIRLVTIEWLVEQRDVVSCGVGAQIIKTGAEPVERLVSADIAAVLALHRAVSYTHLTLPTRDLV